MLQPEVESDEAIEMSGEEPTDEQREEAALWLAKRTGGSFDQAEAKVFDDWLNADLRHRRAFDDVRVLYARLEEPAHRFVAAAPIRRRIIARLQPRWTWLVPPLAAGTALCSIAWLAPDIMQNWQADIVTGTEIVTTVALPDGSITRLGADTAVSLEFHDGMRQVRIFRGEAYFEVKHDVPGRFTVLAGADKVRDIGTKFNVDLDGGRTGVIVAEGAVEVAGSDDATGLVLRQGDEVAILGGRVGAVSKVDTNIALSWLGGRLVVQGAKVESLVRELQRHSKGRVVVIGAVADRTVSGTFSLADVDGSISTIADAVGGSVTRIGPLLTILH
ncbi:FecR domain-containing protein [Neorhizobium sp. NCHU2750]|uniref:FecR family protein n=1 Tax=Neorhizobium sp. NCHU2750 TaxID=1825976 RepID=UPI000E712CD4|nr:transmembrane sensor [Neorhizobium sp. NCHU2750]